MYEIQKYTYCSPNIRVPVRVQWVWVPVQWVWVGLGQAMPGPSLAGPGWAGLAGLVPAWLGQASPARLGLSQPGGLPTARLARSQPGRVASPQVVQGGLSGLLALPGRPFLAEKSVVPGSASGAAIRLSRRE